ncbi:MAG: FAD-binding oxidoreductase [Candidatus Lokiarchaeota archaeon]|nr:FAD-binding oxidoreductase [Candidatus Lokiarchaeota archaeon]
MNESKIEEKEEIGKTKFTKEVEEFIPSPHVSTDIYEIEATSGDLSLLSKYHYKFKEEYRATHVIRPGNTEELSKLMQKCDEYSLPMTLRAAGTSCYSASTPTNGGVIIDLRRMNKVHNIDKANMIVKCDAGISWQKLMEELLEYGLAPKCYPTSYRASCVGGFVATSGKVGVGVLKNGIMTDVLRSVVFVKPDGSTETITRESQGDLSLDNIIGSFGIFGAVAEVELEVTTLKTSLEMVGYSFHTFKMATEFFRTLKNSDASKPLFLSLSDKEFEKYAHWTYPSRGFFVYAVYSDDPSVTSQSVLFAKETASKLDGLSVEEWYLKEKWRDMADTELNLGRWCQNLIFQEYYVSDNRVEDFYNFYIEKAGTKYRKAFYMMSGPIGGNRVKLFGLSDIKDSREFFGIKAVFNDITINNYENGDSLYTLGVVNTFYFLKFHPEKAAALLTMKNKLDPKDLVNSYRLVKAKMRTWRVGLLFWIAKRLYKAA